MPSSQRTDGVRHYRLTVRARLALTSSALLTGAAALMLLLVYGFMRFVPTYALGSTLTAVSATDSDSYAALSTGSTAAEFTPSPVESFLDSSGVVSDGSNPIVLVSSTDQMLSLLLAASLILLVILTAVGIAVGWVVAGRMLAPLHYVNNAAHRAAHGDLGYRIRLSGPRDEISELADNFDEMLTQLERSFTAQQAFAANASHELRTPLATTRAMIDVAIATHAVRSPALAPAPAFEVTREGTTVLEPPADPDLLLLERLRASNERSIQTVEALLDLSQIQGETSPPQQLDLAQVAAEAIIEQGADGAGESRHDLRIDSDLVSAIIDGDPTLLRQLAANLVQNAIRHNVPDGFISIVTRPQTPQSGAFLEVTNSGHDLPAELVDTLVQPFTRGSGRASSDTAGSPNRCRGLGLSIVAAIVERHHGTLEIAARPQGGLRVTVVFAPPHSLL